MDAALRSTAMAVAIWLATAASRRLTMQSFAEADAVMNDNLSGVVTIRTAHRVRQGRPRAARVPTQRNALLRHDRLCSCFAVGKWLETSFAVMLLAIRVPNICRLHNTGLLAHAIALAKGCVERMQEAQWARADECEDVIVEVTTVVQLA